jgi:hypothetical protein
MADTTEVKSIAIDEELTTTDSGRFGPPGGPTGGICVVDGIDITLVVTVGDATGGSDSSRVEVVTPTIGEDNVLPVDRCVVTERARADGTDTGLIGLPPLHTVEVKGDRDTAVAEHDAAFPVLHSLSRKAGALTSSVWDSPVLGVSAPKLPCLSSVSVPDTFIPVRSSHRTGSHQVQFRFHLLSLQLILLLSLQSTHHPLVLTQLLPQSKQFSLGLLQLSGHCYEINTFPPRLIFSQSL